MICRLEWKFHPAKTNGSLGYFYVTFPISVIWLSSLFLFLGGGPLVFASLTVALVADLVPNPSRYCNILQPD
jgi:hypothetical protein